MQRTQYFYEGGCEKELLRYLQDEKLIKPGKSDPFNLWQDKIKSILRKLSDPKRLKIYFIVDTDIKESLSIFKENIRGLKGYNICLIIQNKNLEDELVYSCFKNKKELFKHFDACNKDEFTSNFIKKAKKEFNLKSKLKNCDFSKLWSRNIEFNDFLKTNDIQVNTNCNYKI